MEFKELFNESKNTLTVNKVRTGLAMLGVVIGIGSVIALMGLGQASQKSVTSQIQSLGTNLLTVMPGAVRSGGVRGAVGGRESLTTDDGKALAELDEVAQFSGVISSQAQVIAGRNNTNVSIYGVEAGYAEISNIEMAQGSFITSKQVTGVGRVAVLGATAAEDLFGEGSSPIGEKIRVAGQSLTVIGVAESKGGMGMMSPDENIYVPISTASKVLFGQTYLSSAVLSIKNEKAMDEAESKVTALLLKRHGIKDETKADFRIQNQEDLIGTITEVTGTFTTLLAGIAAISLVVGGIGIMNIMLVTVTERTREIGLRKALGAKKKLITNQFLLESVLITFIGGMIGMLVGIGVSYILSTSMSLPFTVSGLSIMLAFGVSGLIGIVFGWYPAKKAASLEPIEALRYE